MDRRKTCEERIGEALGRHREDWLKYAKLNDLKSEDGLQEFLDEKQEEILSYSKFTVHVIQYSWGGPADWFEIWQDRDTGEIVHINYHFSDWGDHAERRLVGKDFKLAREFLSGVCYLEV